jgi:hypothetical protein
MLKADNPCTISIHRGSHRIENNNSGGLVILKTINIVYHCDLYFNIIQPQIEKTTCVYIFAMCIQCFYTLKDRIWFKYLIAVKV